jgi:hypothetical protein
VAHTQSKEVNVTKSVKNSNGMRYCPVVLSAMGASSLILSSSTDNQNATLKVPTTWNGERTAGASACPRCFRGIMRGDIVIKHVESLVTLASSALQPKATGIPNHPQSLFVAQNGEVAFKRAVAHNHS